MIGYQQDKECTSAYNFYHCDCIVEGRIVLQINQVLDLPSLQQLFLGMNVFQHSQTITLQGIWYSVKVKFVDLPNLTILKCYDHTLEGEGKTSLTLKSMLIFEMLIRSSKAKSAYFWRRLLLYESSHCSDWEHSKNVNSYFDGH